MAWIGKSAWYPQMLGETWKSGLTPLRFWPGGEAANPDAKHPGKARESSAGESELSPADVPGLSWVRSPQTFRNPNASGGARLLIPTMLIRKLRVQGDHPPGAGLGARRPQRSLIHKESRAFPTRESPAVFLLSRRL